jgi:hypothetical protein
MYLSLLFRCNEDYFIHHRFHVAFHQQWNLCSKHFIACMIVSKGLYSQPYLFDDAWMGYGIEIGSGLGIGKYNLCKSRSVDPAIGEHHTLTKALADLIVRRLTYGKHLTRDIVGAQNARTQFCEYFKYCALACTDSTGYAYYVSHTHHYM